MSGYPQKPYDRKALEVLGLLNVLYTGGSSGYTQEQVKETFVVEGLLKSINSVEELTKDLYLSQTFGNKKIGPIYDGTLVTLTLSVTSDRGTVHPQITKFKGTIYPDSVGHELKVYNFGMEGRKIVDVNLNRTYVGRKVLNGGSN